MAVFERVLFDLADKFTAKVAMHPPSIHTLPQKRIVYLCASNPQIPNSTNYRQA